MVPTLAATSGVKGHRPTVGTYGCTDLLSVFAVVNPVTAVAHATPESPEDATKRRGLSKTRRMQAAFASHLRHGGRMDPREKHTRVVLMIDNAPWHRGIVDEALAANPHLEFYRLPRYSPSLNPVERFWKKLRRRAAHNRLFDTPADLKRSVRNSLCYFQTMRERMAYLVCGCYPTPQNATASTNS